MSLLPLADLIIQKPRPDTTLALIPAYWEHSREMVESYIFTDTIRHSFAQILESVVTGAGQGFWVQAEYGAGKTHFLAALAALITNNHDGLWDEVHDEEIHDYRRRLGEARLFPVIVSLRGMGDADASAGRTLLDVILEDGFGKALDAAGCDSRGWFWESAGQGRAGGEDPGHSRRGLHRLAGTGYLPGAAPGRGSVRPA
jgi:hypothetical protein